MFVAASEIVQAPRSKVWAVVSDIQNTHKRISAIKKIEIKEKARDGLLGLKWTETRVMFGQEATETMWITGVAENEWYESTAMNNGCLYKTRVQLEEVENGVRLTMTFKSTPQTITAKLFSPLNFLFSGMIKKAFQKDLSEIKKVVEGNSVLS